MAELTVGSSPRAAKTEPQRRSILCPIGFSEFSNKVYDYAQSLAAHYQAGLWLQHVVYSHGAFYTDDAYRESCRQLRGEMMRKLKQFAKRRTRTKVQPQYLVEEGIASDQILTFAKEHKVGMIVMGTHGLCGIDRLMLGTITERVLRKSPCPVLVVRKPAHDFVLPSTKGDPVKLEKIILGMDFSNHAFRALTYALSFAREYNAELTLLHVTERPAGSADLQMASAEVTKALKQSIPLWAHKPSLVKYLVRRGKPFQQILEVARQEKTDLVIMGVRGRGSLDSALFGSTTYRVIQLGPCPVLAVHW